MSVLVFLLSVLIVFLVRIFAVYKPINTFADPSSYRSVRLKWISKPTQYKLLDLFNISEMKIVVIKKTLGRRKKERRIKEKKKEKRGSKGKKFIFIHFNILQFHLKRKIFTKYKWSKYIYNNNK